MDEKSATFPFETPTRLTIVAATNCGKTFFMKKLLENAKEMFTNDFANVYYHYGSSYQPIFDQMLKSIPNLVFRQVSGHVHGMPTCHGECAGYLCRGGGAAKCLCK